MAVQEGTGAIFFTIPNNPSFLRYNLTLWVSNDQSASWQVVQVNFILFFYFFLQLNIFFFNTFNYFINLFLKGGREWAFCVFGYAVSA
jgi:hypothetical protein